MKPSKNKGQLIQLHVAKKIRRVEPDEFIYIYLSRTDRISGTVISNENKTITLEVDEYDLDDPTLDKIMVFNYDDITDIAYGSKEWVELK